MGFRSRVGCSKPERAHNQPAELGGIASCGRISTSKARTATTTPCTGDYNITISAASAAPSAPAPFCGVRKTTRGPTASRDARSGPQLATD